MAVPFALVSIFIAMVWGLGPTLFSAAFGLLILIRFIAPNAFTQNIFLDVELDGPFVFFQLLAVAVVLWLERSRQKLLAAHQQLEIAHQELGATHQQLLQSKNQLEEANHLKDYIITRASHELKTPLTAILGYTQLLSSRLKKLVDPPENRSFFQTYLEIIEARAHHLRGLIDRLFDISRVQAQAPSFQRHSLDFGVLCRNVVADQQDLSGRSIQLELPTQAIMLPANEELLSQVLGPQTCCILPVQKVARLPRLPVNPPPEDSARRFRPELQDHSQAPCHHLPLKNVPE